MMNLPTSNESYYPSIMPFFSIEGSDQQNKDQSFVGDLMTRPISSEPCYPSIMPFFGIDESNKQQSPHTTISPSFLNTQQRAQFSSFMDYSSAPLVPLSNHNRYSVNSGALTEYHAGLVRPFEDKFSYGAATATTTTIANAPLGLNLSQYHHSYYSLPASTSNFNRMLWRSRGGYFFGHQPPRCQAEGCKADLSNAKRYHRRHKVCEFHSKASVVVISGGLQQRFCQQCSRFHSLDEFDEAKKSCRKRLADHNRRRRKPQQPSSPTSNNPTNKKKPATQNTSETRINKNITEKKSSEKDQKQKTTNLKIGSSLSLGGTEKLDNIGFMNSNDHHSQLHHNNKASQFCSDNKASEYQFQLDSYRSSTPNYNEFNQQSISCSSSSAILQSIGENCELTHQHHTSFLHVGQSMFDFA